MFAVFYFILIRPEKKRKKQAEDMRNGLKKGDKITTIGGIMGAIVVVNSDSIVIETSEDRVRMELAKWAVGTNHTQAPVQVANKKSKKAKKDAEIAETSETTEPIESSEDK